MPVEYVNHLPADFDDVSLRADVRGGLTRTPRQLPPKWFYDKVGSELFEEITRLPEYYPTRSERAILERHAGELAALAGCDTLVELGSGSSGKTRLLLDALAAARPGRTDPLHYVAVDVSEDALRGAADGLARDRPDLAVTIVRADFETQLGLLAAGGGRRMVAFLGSTIGNLEPAARARFLDQVRGMLRPGECFLLGADLVKSPDVLVRAYDDAAGVTAAFNLNVLDVLNGRLGGDADRADFAHVARWDAEHEWIEMRLRARRALRWTLAEVGLTVDVAAGEEIRTEISAKFRREPLTAELHAAGFAGSGWWTDPDGLFSLSLWEAQL
jgi:L-histidine Nalpha-methyltransferase